MLERLSALSPAADYADWGLHLWGDAVAPDVLASIPWDSPLQRNRVVDGWAVYGIPLKTDEAPVVFIMHRPNGDSVPDTRERTSATPTASESAAWVLTGAPLATRSPGLPR